MSAMTRISSLHTTRWLCLLCAAALMLVSACGEGTSSGLSVADTAGDGDNDPTAAWQPPPWPDNAHGFPQDTVQLDCDPQMFSTFSPAIMREKAYALVHGTVLAVEVPDRNPASGATCAGDRAGGLRLLLHVERSIGPYAPSAGTEVAVYVPEGSISAWSRTPLWLRSDDTVRWTWWASWSEEDADPVPRVGGQVLIQSVPTLATENADTFLLRGDTFYTVTEAGDVVPQRDMRGACRDRLEVDGAVLENYGPIDPLWERIAGDALTAEEQGAVAAWEMGEPRFGRSESWVRCLGE